MARGGASGRYAWMWFFGLALGWFEVAVVVYLRALYYPGGFRFPVVLIWDQIAVVEVFREGASLLLLAAGARLAGETGFERFAAFTFLFGLWDLVYYAGLKLVLGWPASLATWDILFLIPAPWVGPVWAPCAVSLALVVSGTYLYWTSDRPRVIRALDWVIEVSAGLLVIASFILAGRVVAEGRMPGAFPSWLFWTGWLLGVLWFIGVERRGAT